MLNKLNISRQTTVSNKVSCAGVGLHSGKKVSLSINPASADSGIVFKRLDVEAKKSLIPAVYHAVCETTLGTKICNEYGVTVATIEHLMAAIWGWELTMRLLSLMVERFQLWMEVQSHSFLCWNVQGLKILKLLAKLCVF